MQADPSVPSIKGSAFQSVVDDVRRLVDEGRLDLEEIGLSDKDRALLDSLITPVSWMPVDTYDRLLQVLCEIEGGDDPVAYLHQRGARAAERLFSTSYRSFQVAPGSWDPRVAETFVGISKMLYNFAEWSVTQDTGEAIGFRVDDAADLPDTAIETARGFLTYFAELAADCPVEVKFTRISKGSFSMNVWARPEEA